ncbi:hypothetical protein L1987_51252 [Smallanthus sonchifolius]|uniref:Uncharacterized protein n=1 Tax=Smallanthus sonchifolius TaxID=185202 RepID=A0ACB9EPS3_9ASTR|nr:hypothetical protein L1987_51252 [Smallanthus sonchifolius]
MNASILFAKCNSHLVNLVLPCVTQSTMSKLVPGLHFFMCSVADQQVNYKNNQPPPHRRRSHHHTGILHHS